jgi:RNA polymerase sigma-70 factor (ECF subfamily)
MRRRTPARGAILASERSRIMPLTVEEVHERFDAGLRRFVAARVRDPDSAENLVQDVYLKIQTRIGTLEDKEKVGAWVYGVARNAVYDFYRTRKPTQELDEIVSPTPDPTEDEMEARLSESVRGMLDGLSPDQKTALYLTEYEGMTQSDLAAELGISVSGAKSRVQRARARLKALLLDCCHFELDRRGKVINYYDRERTPDPHPGTP